MQVCPLTEPAAEELLTITAARTPNDTQAEALARKQIVRDLGYLPVAISVVGGILRGSFGSQPISCQSYLRRCEESRDADLEESLVLTNYPSVWTASNARRAAGLVLDCIELYRLLDDHEESLQSGNESTNSRVLRELQLSTNDYVPLMEMHSLLKKWFRREHSTKVDSFARPKLWLLSFGMYKALNWPESTVLPHEAVMAFILASTTAFADARACLPVKVAEQPGLLAYSDDLRAAIKVTCGRQARDIDWTTVFEQLMEQLGRQIKTLVDLEPLMDPQHTEDAELRLGGQGGLITESRLSTCLDSKATQEAAEISSMSTERRRRQLQNWAQTWIDDIFEIVKRGLDQALRTVCRLGDNIEAPNDAFFPVLRRVTADVVREALDESGALDALDARREELKEAHWELSMWEELGPDSTEAEEFYWIGTDDVPLFVILREVTWMVALWLFVDNVGSVILDSISQEIQDTVIWELEEFLLPGCGSRPIAHDLAAETKHCDLAARIRSMQPTSFAHDGDLGDHDAETGERLRSDVDRTYGCAHASAVRIGRFLYGGDQDEPSSEVVVREFKDIFECRRALHHYILWAFSRPVVDMTVMSAFHAMGSLERDEDLEMVCSIISGVSAVAYDEELSTLQEVEKRVRKQRSRGYKKTCN
ncbi:hypothetical protein C8A03DRAFT_46714 [Achaetomium macrosporum]|uniref:Uncharacterized protein n=1 Tax=Achaetomium macrosporum TaxID=79813 RepID=A0AAN7HBF5_9PEZI|nr:hypothetical protein C8A03DRAFT_46714 [Achaetomium macrosporum]